MREPHSNYRVPPIDEHRERTETFQWLSRVNRTFLKSTGMIMKDLVLQKVSHVEKAWGGIPLFETSEIVKQVTSFQNVPLIISEFKNPEGKDYIAVVNNSQRENTEMEIQVEGEKMYNIGWMGKEILISAIRPGTGENLIKIRQWLAPGQMELYRIEGQAVR